MIYNIKKELNKTYLLINVSSEEDDYRANMLSENVIEGIIPIEIREIDGRKQYYYDISDKINLPKALSLKYWNYDDVKLFTGDLLAVSERLCNFLMDEDSLVLEQDLIFKDVKSGKYHFICIPESISGRADEMKELWATILENINPSDEAAVKCSYEIYEMVASGSPRILTIYETVINLQEETEIIEEPPEVFLVSKEEFVPLEKQLKYYPSFKEWACAAMMAVGIFFVGVWAYLDVI